MPKLKKLKCDILGNFQTLWSKSNNCCYQYCAAKSNKKDQLEYSWKKMVYYNSKPRTSNEGPCYDASIWFRSVSWLFLQLGFAPLRHLRFTTLEVEFPRELVQARAILIFRQKMGKSNEGNSISLACQQRNSLRLNFSQDWVELSSSHYHWALLDLPAYQTNSSKQLFRKLCLVFTTDDHGFILDSCVYRPLLTAVFSCLQIVPPTNKMKAAKNEIIETSLKLRLKPRPRVIVTIATIKIFSTWNFDYILKPLATSSSFSAITWNLDQYTWILCPNLNPLPKSETSTQTWNLYPNLKPLPKPESLINT